MRTEYLPIAPSEPHPDNGRLLHLDGYCKQPLRKRSYIKAATPRIVPLAVLRHYNRDPWARSSDYILRSDSYELLFGQCDTSVLDTHMLPTLRTHGNTNGALASPVPLPAGPELHRPSATTFHLSGNGNQVFMLPPIPHRYAPPRPYRPSVPVTTPARGVPGPRVSHAPLYGYGTNTTPYQGAWGQESEWERRHRLVQPLYSEPREERTRGDQISAVHLVAFLLVMAAGTVIMYAGVMGLFQLALWLGDLWKSAIHFAGPIWVAIRDTVEEWIEALKELVE